MRIIERLLAPRPAPSPELFAFRDQIDRLSLRDLCAFNGWCSANARTPGPRALADWEATRLPGKGTGAMWTAA